MFVNISRIAPSGISCVVKRNGFLHQNCFLRGRSTLDFANSGMALSAALPSDCLQIIASHLDHPDIIIAFGTVNVTGQMEESLRTIADCHREIGQIRGRREGRREGLREGYQAGLLAAGFAALVHLISCTSQQEITRKLLLLLLWFGMVCTAGAFGYCCLFGPEEHVGSVFKN